MRLDTFLDPYSVSFSCRPVYGVFRVKLVPSKHIEG